MFDELLEVRINDELALIVVLVEDDELVDNDVEL